jgi:hypothetical protein
VKVAGPVSVALSALGLAAALAAQAPPAPTPAPLTALKAARLFDGKSDTTQPNAVVLV